MSEFLNHTHKDIHFLKKPYRRNSLELNNTSSQKKPKRFLIIVALHNYCDCIKGRNLRYYLYESHVLFTISIFLKEETIAFLIFSVIKDEGQPGARETVFEYNNKGIQ